MGNRKGADGPPFETQAARPPQGEVNGMAVSGASEAAEPPPRTSANHRNAETPPPGEATRQPPPTSENHSNGEMQPTCARQGEAGVECEAEAQQWRRKVKSLMHDYWPCHAAIDAVDDETADRWTAKWIAEGRNYGHDIYPAVRDFYIMQPSLPPTDWRQLDALLRRSAAPA